MTSRAEFPQPASDSPSETRKRSVTWEEAKIPGTERYLVAIDFPGLDFPILGIVDTSTHTPNDGTVRVCIHAGRPGKKFPKLEKVWYQTSLRNREALGHPERCDLDQARQALGLEHNQTVAGVKVTTSFVGKNTVSLFFEVKATLKSTQRGPLSSDKRLSSAMMVMGAFNQAFRSSTEPYPVKNLLG